MVLVFNFLNKPEEILNLKKEEEIADMIVEYEEVKEEEIETPIDIPVQPTETSLEPTESETQTTNTQDERLKAIEEEIKRKKREKEFKSRNSYSSFIKF
jgi:hypothetical protein